MLKKTIKYTDYNGVERNEDFYFNLNKAELMEMEMLTPGGMSDMIKNIVKAQDTPSIMKIFKEIIVKSYGEKSADGKRFIKSQELTDAFTQTEAYAQLFTELATNDVEAAKFIRGIVPGDIDISDKQIQEELKKLDVEVPAIDTSTKVENTENK